MRHISCAHPPDRWAERRNWQGFRRVSTRTTVYTRLSSRVGISRLNAEALFRPEFPGHERISVDEIAQRMIRGFGDSDAGSGDDVARRETVVADPESAGRKREVAAIVPLASDAECLTEAAGPTGQLQQIFRAGNDNAARIRHLLDSRQRLGCTEQYTSGLAFGFAGDVQAIVIPVNEVDICVAWRAEEHGIAQSASGSGMRRGIFLPEIGFDFNNASRQLCLRQLVNQDLPEQLPRNTPRIAREKAAI